MEILMKMKALSFFLRQGRRGAAAGMFLAAVVCAVHLLVPAAVRAESFTEMPRKFQAALLVKVLGMSKEVTENADVSIHVIGDPEAAEELKKGLGRRLGKAELKTITASDDLPRTPPSAIYIGSAEMAEEARAYCRKHGILSICSLPELMEKGVTLGFAMEGGKPKILLNLSATKEEGVTWDPVMYKISRIQK